MKEYFDYNTYSPAWLHHTYANTCMIHCRAEGEISLSSVLRVTDTHVTVEPEWVPFCPPAISGWSKQHFSAVV